MAPVRDTTFTADGAAATARVRLSTGDGAALARDVTVDWATGSGTATAGRDYARSDGTLRFAAGTASGAVRTIGLDVARTDRAETAERIPVRLTARGVRTTDPVVVVDAHGLPYLDASLSPRARAADLVGRMTLAEKVGQMTQTERYQAYDDPSVITSWRVGSILSGGGSTPTPNTPEAWADMVDQFQSAALTTRLQIPLIYGIDSVHGHGNLVGATVFPHNIGLGATRDPALVRRAAHVTAEETRATGPQWIFGPCLCSAQDDRWGRTYESFGEAPELVRSMETAVDGFQGPDASGLADPTRVLATVKHFAGDGNTEYGTGSGDYPIDQGVTVTSRRDFWASDLTLYESAVRDHAAGSVMPSYSSVDWTEDGEGNPLNMHAHHELLTDVLKGAMDFDGFVVSDWEGIHHIPGTLPVQVRRSVMAGVDMFMEPNAPQDFQAALTRLVRRDRVPMWRIDDAVRRILVKKVELGLFEQPYTPREHLDEIGSAQHRALARRAVAESQVLLKNRAAALPLAADEPVYVAGSNADDIGNQAGGWTVTWQGASGDTIPGTTVLEGIEAAADGEVTYSEDASAPVDAEVGVVVVGETPYAEGFGDVGGPEFEGRPSQTMELSDADSAAVDTVCAAVERCVVLVVSGRPIVLDDAQRGTIDALVASWLPGSEGAGVADVLYGERPFTGRLPVSWPRTVDQEPINVGDVPYNPLYPFGYGLTF